MDIGSHDARRPSPWTPWAMFAGTLLVLLAGSWSTLDRPLYEDQAVGFGREADYLDQTNFDYWKLRYEEPHFMFGGTARSYMVSAIPTLLALLRRACDSVETTLWVWHLASFVGTAAVAGLVVSLLQGSIGAYRALLASATLLSTPMLLAQAGVAGMEIPLLFFSLLAGRSLTLGQPYRAIGWSILAFFMKASGLLTLGATWIILLLRIITSHRRSSQSPSNHLVLAPAMETSPNRSSIPGRFGPPSSLFMLRVSGLLGLAAMVGLTALLAWGDDTALFRATFHWPSAFRVPRVWAWCPDMLIVPTIVAALAIGSFVKAWPAVRRSGWNIIDPMPAPILLGFWALMIASGTIASMANYIFLPRYFVFGLVMCYLLWGLFLVGEGWVTHLGTIGLWVMLVINVLNQGGLLYPPVARWAGPDLDTLAVFSTRSCAFTERSLEYALDQQASQQIVQAAVQQASSGTLFAEMPHWTYLTSPFVGYVRSVPKDVVRADRFTRVIRTFRDRVLSTPPEHEILFLWSTKGSVRMPTPGEGVEVLASDGMDPPLLLCRVDRSSLPKDARGIEDWFLDHTWNERHALHRAIDRFEFLRQTHRIERASRELHFARWRFPHPNDPEVRGASARLSAALEDARQSSVVLNGETWLLDSQADALTTLSLHSSGKRLLVANRFVPGRDLKGVRLWGIRRFLRETDAGTVRFRIRSTRPCSIRAAIRDPFQPDAPADAEQMIDVGESWQSIEMTSLGKGFRPDATLVLEIGRSNVTFELEQPTFDGAPSAEPSKQDSH